MPTVKLPDGRKVKFPDDMPTEEIRALIEHKFPKETAQRKAQATAAPGAKSATDKLDETGNIVPLNPMAQGAPAPETNTGDMGGQIISGLHEGVGATLSFPNQVARSLESIGPTVVNALGGNAAMPPESGYLPDAGADYQKLGTDAGFIHPESADPIEKFARKGAQYVGGMIVPGVGPVSEAVTAGKMLKVASPAALGANLKTIGSNSLKATGVAAKELASATGAGLGAATANAVAPDNPLAEVAGALVGGGATVGTLRGMRRGVEAKTAPSVESLKSDAGTLYRTAESRGVVAPQAATQTLAQDMRGIATAEEVISPTGRFNNSYPRIVEAVKTFEDYGSGPMTVKQMQAVRQKLTDAAASNEPGESRIAMKMLKKFDAFVDPLAPELAQANSVYHRAMNAERIDTQIALAKSDAGDLTGAGFENTLRRRFQELERGIEKGDVVGFSPEEVDAIKKVAHGGPAQSIFRWAGKFAPTGVVSAGMTGTLAGGLAGVVGLPALPVGMAVAGLGIGGRAAATAIRSGNAKIASALSRRGGVAGGPSLSPSEATAAGSIANTAANNNYVGKTVSLADFVNVGRGAALQATH